MNNLEIPNIIKNQLMVLDRNLMMCLGSHNFRGGNEVDGKHMGYLMFDIQNLKEITKGTIQILLNNKDLYDIKIYKEDFELFANVEDIYCDSMTGVIESLIGHWRQMMISKLSSKL